MLSSLTSYEQALNSLGIDTQWSSSFGNPGEGGFVEYRRDAFGNVYTVSNGSWMDFAPFNWSAKRLDKMPAPAALEAPDHTPRPERAPRATR